MRLSEQSLYVLAEQIRTQKISPVELVEDIFQQIEEKEQQHNAYIDIQKDRAFHLAKEAEREISEGKYRGPLHGIPIGIKDNIYFANETTTMG
ncbi:MAG TPA: amidase family protein, partial [Savagea sp.]